MDTFLYNTDRADNGAARRSFTVNADGPVVITNAGLTACVPVFVAVGGCAGCGFRDRIWRPLERCGNPVEVCPSTSHLYIYEEGQYSLGDPNNALVLPGDVNIVYRVDKNLTMSEAAAMGKCAAPPSPLFPVETALAELGCIVGADGQLIGKVFICKITDEITGNETTVLSAYYEDGTVVNPYSGPWSVCQPDVCVGEAFIGVITDLSILAN